MKYEELPPSYQEVVDLLQKNGGAWESDYAIRDMAKALGISIGALRQRVLKMLHDGVIAHNTSRGRQATRVWLAVEIAPPEAQRDETEAATESPTPLTDRQNKTLGIIRSHEGLVISENGNSVLAFLAQSIGIGHGYFMQSIWAPLKRGGLVCDNHRQGFITTAAWLEDLDLDLDLLPEPTPSSRRLPKPEAKPTFAPPPRRKPPLDPTTPIGRVHQSLVRGGLTLRMLTLQVNLNPSLDPLSEEEVEEALDELVAKSRARVIYDGSSVFGTPLKEWLAA